MELKGARVLLTGASGGIGSALARELAARGACIGLAGRRADALAGLQARLSAQGTAAETIVADIASPEGRAAAVQAMARNFGGIDILINNAGVSAFAEFSTQDEVQMEKLVRINLLAPMALSRLVLPDMLASGHGRIVNIGSVFGSIGFAWFTGYSATKFGLRGFSEALRRELEGSGVEVLYVAPRAVNTPFNSEAMYRMAEHVNMNRDEPGWVAQRVVAALRADRREVFLGFPESLFVRINALLPRLVDRALRRQNREGRAFLQG
jgi:short-subunit dehydrogenase